MNEGPANGPIPSKHVFLKELAKLPGGCKVRFLGWYAAYLGHSDYLGQLVYPSSVVDYNASEGYLTVQHDFPKTASPVPHVTVNIDLILETTKCSELQYGAWVNIIGYVERSTLGAVKRKRSSSYSKPQGFDTKIQAVLLWDAGAIDVPSYERTIALQQEVLQTS